eukprot:s57_g73.t1
MVNAPVLLVGVIWLRTRCLRECLLRWLRGLRQLAVQIVGPRARRLAVVARGLAVRPAGSGRGCARRRCCAGVQAMPGVQWALDARLPRVARARIANCLLVLGVRVAAGLGSTTSRLLWGRSGRVVLCYVWLRWWRGEPVGSPAVCNRGLPVGLCPMHVSVREFAPPGVCVRVGRVDEEDPVAAECQDMGRWCRGTGVGSNGWRMADGVGDKDPMVRTLVVQPCFSAWVPRVPASGTCWVLAVGPQVCYAAQVESVAAGRPGEGRFWSIRVVDGP